MKDKTGQKWVWLVLVGAMMVCDPALAVKGPYEANWESLSKHYQTPEWFRDAKFGIYTHWGPVTVGAETVGVGGVQWYGRNMYRKEDKLFEAHRKHFGDQKDFGYKDVIPLFKAERFSAEEWAEFFAASGARFAGPVAVHHDNFAMWDSQVTPWNSKAMGPRRDITGELEKAIRSRGMRFITTFHHAFPWRYFEGAFDYDAGDPRYQELYTEKHDKAAPPAESHHRQFLAMAKEVIRKYEPDLVWFDMAFAGAKYKCLTEQTRMQMFADYYNWAAAQGRQVGFVHKHWHIHRHAGIIDFERGRMDKKTDFAWLTDTSVGPWFHVKNAEYRTVNQLIDVLIDIVSKNGCMLLNVDPKMDGSIPKTSKELLLGMGRWLRVNGAALYDTRPWEVYGEGPSKMEGGGGFSERKPVTYTGQDIRYTQSKDGKALYAIALDWPGKELVLRSVQVKGKTTQARVEFLGGPPTMPYHINDQQQIVIPLAGVHASHLGTENAYAFRLSGFDLRSQPTEAALADTKKLRFSFITCAVEAAFFGPVKKGVQDAALALGVTCDFMGTKGVDIPAQAAMVTQVVADGYDGIALNIIDPEAFDEVAQAAMDKGVPVVAFNVDDHATPNARISSVNQRLYEAGRSLGEHVSQFIPPKAHVLITMHDEGVSALEDRLRGLQEVFQLQGISWTVLISGNDAVKGADVITKALKADPRIRVVLGT